MSAFMLEREVFQAIANTLAKPLPSAFSGGVDPALALRLRPDATEPVEKLVSTIVREWYDANRLAVGCRYSERQSHAGWSFAPKRSPTFNPVSFIKTMHCLAYQCSEDVPAAQADQHNEMIDEIRKAGFLMADAFISASDAYDKVPWGREPVV
jgi:hypothetical protein